MKKLIDFVIISLIGVCLFVGFYNNSKNNIPENTEDYNTIPTGSSCIEENNPSDNSKKKVDERKYIDYAFLSDTEKQADKIFSEYINSDLSDKSLEIAEEKIHNIINSSNELDELQKAQCRIHYASIMRELRLPAYHADDKSLLQWIKDETVRDYPDTEQNQFDQIVCLRASTGYLPKVITELHPYQEAIYAGLINPDDAKLTPEKAKEVLDNLSDYQGEDKWNKVLEEFKTIQKYPDRIVDNIGLYYITNSETVKRNMYMGYETVNENGDTELVLVSQYGIFIDRFNNSQQLISSQRVSDGISSPYVLYNLFGIECSSGEYPTYCSAAVVNETDSLDWYKTDTVKVRTAFIEKDIELYS